MPKKQPKNAFYFFMVDFKEEQRKSGINYANMAEVAQAAGPVWASSPPSIRAKYENISKREKQKNNVPEKKYTSLGESIADLEQRQREIREAEQAECQDIKDFVTLECFDKENRLTFPFFLIDVNVYCKTGSDYIIGEITLLQVSLKDGITNRFHMIIEPGFIPPGYALEMKMACQELGLKMPGDSEPTNYMRLLAAIMDFIKKSPKNIRDLWPVYTMPDKVAPIKSFIQQCCYKAGEDEGIFRVYKLDLFFFTLINALRTRSDEGFPTQALATLQLKKDTFKYTPELACLMHEQGEQPTACTRARAMRWAFTVLDCCCPVAGVAATPGLHLPADYDMEAILNVRNKTTGTGTHVAGGSEAGDTSLDSINEEKPKRTHVPLRMPNILPENSYAPPAFTESNFPSLGSISKGRGRVPKK